jgi:ferrochelatase
MISDAKNGVLLVNLGSPDEPTTGAVRRYLREFLGDPRVLDMSSLGRALLLNLVILPFRPRRSAAAYEKVWTPAGSPLIANGRALRDGLRKALGDDWTVELAMRYGTPTIERAVARLADADVERIVVVPLFPQYASASTGSALEAVYCAAAERWNVPPLDVLPSFYAEPGYIAAMAAVARELPEEKLPDHVLISFHGLPERQIRKSDPTGAYCFASESCCDEIGPANRFCYRAQCAATARALAKALGLGSEHWTMSFQSRLGRTPWIKPYTDEVLPQLFERGFRRLAVVCPSFVADCLETLEEIGIRAQEQWLGLGGEDLVLIPCVNAHPTWVDVLAGWIRQRSDAFRPGE